MLNLPPPPGFQGSDACKPVTMYHRYLPHWRQDGATYFVTFRQGDSLPQAKLDELRWLKEEWERCNPAPRSTALLEEFARRTMARVEGWLDQGLGTCRLRDCNARQLVVDAMHHFDGERYQLCCFVVMPNHGHVVLRPLMPAEHPLEAILQSWKSYTARGINALFGVTGMLWQPESFDRIVRDLEHLFRSVQYIGRNPRQAGLGPSDVALWIRPDWKALGWGFATEELIS